MPKQKQKKANGHWTIHDIAQQAGVSPKTVSRVINEEPGVGPATRLRIQQLIEEVGYHPHSGARSMRSAPTDSVGVITAAPMSVVPLSQQFFLWLFKELYRVFCSQGLYVCLDLNPYKKGPAMDYARGLWEQRYSASLVLGPIASNDTTIRRIHESGIPYVAYGRLDSFPECHYATVNYDDGAYVSTKHLLERGHTKVAMLKAFEGFQPGVERMRGYARAMDEAGLAVDEKLIRSVSFGSRHVMQSVYSLLQDRTVTAFVDCSATEDAASIREGARRAGRTLGKDVELVTWTYTPNATVLGEACAHVWLPVRESAIEGLDLLAKRIRERSDEPIQILYPPTLFETVDKVEVPKPIPMFDVFS